MGKSNSSHQLYVLCYVANVAIMHILQKRKHIIDGDLQK